MSPSSPSRRFLLTLCAAASSACGPARLEETSGPLEAPVDPAAIEEATPSLLELGRTTYAKECIACHGELGNGEGEAAYLLYPRPRDFTRGEYRLVSTWDRVPTDEDLFRTISRGMPGSAMPSWSHLPERTRWGLVHYVKTFSTHSLEIRETYTPTRPFEEGRGFLEVPPELPYDEAAKSRARELYRQNCAACHGETARGDGRQDQIDSKGRPTRPRDLTAGIFKGSPSPEHVYRRIVAGLPGSPMPMSPYIYGPDAWHLTHYVLSLSSPSQQAKNEMKKFRIVAARVPSLPTHPDDGLWRETEAVSLHLMPLWWRDDRPEEVTVKAVHDGKEIALLMVWPDASYDSTAIRPQDFRDGAAVQLYPGDDPPFFGMGQPGFATTIWMWKAERQADLDPAFQEIDKIYPNIGIDSYPNFTRSALEQPTRGALTLDADPTYVTGWGAGNIVSDPTAKSATEDLTAQGFGTLRARPALDREVDGLGVYSTGSYRVLFRRALRSAASKGISFSAGERFSVSFAVWNGSAGDRDGKKSVTIWQQLVLEP
jgi:mono/diheme cytochrome c family protein